MGDSQRFYQQQIALFPRITSVVTYRGNSRGTHARPAGALLPAHNYITNRPEIPRQIHFLLRPDPIRGNLNLAALGSLEYDRTYPSLANTASFII